MKQISKLIYSSERGSAMAIAVITSAVVLTVTASLVISISKMNMFGGSSTRNFGSTITVAQQQIVTILENDAAWAATIAANPSMACINSPTTNCSNVLQDFSLRLPDGTVFNNNTGNQGFTKRGHSCSSYVSTPGADAICVYKIRLQWRCLDNPCTTPVSKRTRISVQFKHYYNSKSDNNNAETLLTQYTADVLRGNVAGSIKASCDAMGGVLEEGGVHCRIFPSSNVDCLASTGLHMVDKVQGGVVSCTEPTAYGDGTNPFKCNSGSAMTGFLNDHPSCDVF